MNLKKPGTILFRFIILINVFAILCPVSSYSAGPVNIIESALNTSIRFYPDGSVDPRLYHSPGKPSWTLEKKNKDNPDIVQRLTVRVNYFRDGELLRYNVLVDVRTVSNGNVVSRVQYIDVGANGFKKEIHRYHLNNLDQDQIINSFGLEGKPPYPKALVRDLTDATLNKVSAYYDNALQAVIDDINFHQKGGGSIFDDGVLDTLNYSQEVLKNVKATTGGSSSR